MVNKTNNSSTEAVPSEGVLTDMTSLERRRLLFKAIGKGATVGAVLSSPMLAMADSDNNVNGSPILVCDHPTSSQLIMCSVSGMQSAIGSRHLQQITAQGHSPGYWGKLSREQESCKNYGTVQTPVWGPTMERTCPAYTWGKLVKDVLDRTKIVKRTISDGDWQNLNFAMLMAKGNRDECETPNETEVEYGGYSESEECHWICAIFNAATYYPLGTFPYDVKTILEVANGVNTKINRADLYKLLTSLENQSSKSDSDSD